MKLTGLPHGALFARALLAALAFAAGYGIHDLARSEASAPVRRESFALHRLTSPYLEPGGTRSGAPEFKALQTDLEELLDAERRRDDTFEAGVYVQRLTDGAWLGIHEHRPFRPASLWKVAVLYHVLGRVEDDPAVLEQQLRFPGPADMPSPSTTDRLPPDHQLTPGMTYTRDELLRRMIAFSDNHAADLLMQGTPRDEVTGLMLGLGVELFHVDGALHIDASEYTLLFSILYHSSFFSRPLSERALDYLAQGAYRNGIRQAVPAEVAVASKFGIVREDAEVQLHECGIVYATDPYALCVMTRAQGSAEADLARVLSAASARVYRRLAGATAP